MFSKKQKTWHQTGFTPLERNISPASITSLPQHSQKDALTGFTILEMLVVLAVIGLIASFVLVQTTGIRAKSRDANREESVKQFQNGLDLYHVTHLRYPICAKGVINGTTDCLSAALIADGAFTAVPIDPLGGASGNPVDCANPPAVSGVYIFCYESIDGASYILWHNLETDSIQGKNQGWQTVSP